MTVKKKKKKKKKKKIQKYTQLSISPYHWFLSVVPPQSSNKARFVALDEGWQSHGHL